MTVSLYLVDAFASRPFEGNPAAVCLLEGPADEHWMQQVASEMNLSETAFLFPMQDGYSLRWFTPAYEVDLCGHATLASAHVLWASGQLTETEEARFMTRSGVLTARKTDPWIEMDFPSEVPEPVAMPGRLAEAFPGLEPVAVTQNRMDYLIAVADEEAVRNTSPNMALLAEIEARGVIITAPAGPTTPAADFVSRFFAPGAGVPEDPVTGSAHCALAPYWSARMGRDVLMGYQASQRGGWVRTTWSGDRVLLGGQAVTQLTGQLRVY